MKVSILAVQISFILSLSCNHQQSKQETTGEKNKIDTGITGENKSNKELAGAWLEPNPINTNEKQGFELKKDGSALSVNMATLQYEKWWANDNNLTLVTKSIGNHQTIMDTSTYEIIKLTADTLALKKGELILKYSKTANNK